MARVSVSASRGIVWVNVHNNGVGNHAKEWKEKLAKGQEVEPDLAICSEHQVLVVWLVDLQTTVDERLDRICCSPKQQQVNEAARRES